MSCETWELLRTDSAGEWEPVRTFDRLDDACRCIMEMETQGPRRLALQGVASITDQDATAIELVYEGRGSAYRIKGCPPPA